MTHEAYEALCRETNSITFRLESDYDEPHATPNDVCDLIKMLLKQTKISRNSYFDIHVDPRFYPDVTVTFVESPTDGSKEYGGHFVYSSYSLEEDEETDDDL